MSTINNSEVLRRSKYSALDAIRYIKTHTGLSLQDSKIYLDKLMNDQITSTGTITWYEIAIDGLPARVDTEKYKLVLMYNDTLYEAVEGHYNFDNGEWRDTKGIKYPATHWAYINYPKTT